MINEKINKSFLNIPSPPFFSEIWQSPNLLNVPKPLYQTFVLYTIDSVLLIVINIKILFNQREKSIFLFLFAVNICNFLNP